MPTLIAGSSRRLRGPSKAGARRLSGSSGLSLLELMAALLVLGLVLSLTRPALNGVSARWRLRAAAQEVESAVHWARNAAAVRGAPADLRYDVSEGAYWVDLGDETETYRTLPRGVRFGYVRLGGIEVVNDIALVRVFPDGSLDGHELTLEGGDGLRIRMTFRRLTGEAAYEETQDGAR